MFANLKKKIEAEVGDNLSRLAPSLRSITSQSERLTPLSSRHNSVSSLTSETTSYTNKLSGPQSPLDSQTSPQTHYGSGGGSSSKHEGANGGSSSSNKMDLNQQKVKRQFEEKIQTMELDFAWRLSTKDEEISKLQKQVEKSNTLLHSKEFETQQKLVRVQEDMDSLEGFSQQENAKIKHLLLNREEELSQLRAAVMFKDSRIVEFETQVKGISLENERLRKNLDEVISRQRVAKPEEEVKDSKFEEQSKLIQEKVELLEIAKKDLELELKTKEETVGKLLSDLKSVELGAETLRKENSFVLKELKDLQSKLNHISQEQVTHAKENEEVVSGLRSELKKYQDLVSTDKEELQKKEEVKAALESQLKSLHEQVDGFQQDNNSLHAEIQSLKSREVGFESRLNEKDSIVNQLRQQITELVGNVEKREKVMASLQEELRDLISEKSEADEKLQGVEKKLLVLENRLAEKDTQDMNTSSENIQRLMLQLEDKNETIFQLQAQVGKLANIENQNVELAHQISDIQVKCDAMKQENDQYNLNMQRLELQLKDREKTNFDLQIKIGQLEAQVERLGNVEKQNEELTLQVSEIQRTCDAIWQESTKKDREIIANLESELKIQEELVITTKQQLHDNDGLKSSLQSQLKSMQEKVAQLELDKNSLHAEIKAHMSGQSGLEYNLKKKDAIASDLRLQLAELTKDIQMHDTTAIKLRDEYDELAAELQMKEGELQAALDNISLVQSKMSEKVLQESSAASEEITRLESQLKEKDENLALLQVQVDEISTFELENSDLILQISEIQSKCDELEEENRFLKDSAPKDEYDALKRKISDMEGDLLDKTQMLKQQSLQLQDLRRSLAKEINKNQALSESTSPMEMASQSQSQCNGSSMNQVSVSAMSSVPVSSMQPPTLPPQETDVNFMYLRSVLFKYLTTTDVQVTHQLTRVVATLLHLNEEESHLLLQSTESKNGFFHLLSKS